MNGDACALVEYISIHTPTQGVTKNEDIMSKINKISIHTPTQGVTKQLIVPLSDIVFQSTLPRRE